MISCCRRLVRIGEPLKRTRSARRKLSQPPTVASTTTMMDRTATYACRQVGQACGGKIGFEQKVVGAVAVRDWPCRISLFVETYRTEQGSLKADDMNNEQKIEFDYGPPNLREGLCWQR